jgi:predicted DCC family thiol-disulfide oxidoreductase YuxK
MTEVLGAPVSGAGPAGAGVVFYDGRCPLCAWSVRFLLRADCRKNLLFAPFEGRSARSILQGGGTEGGRDDSVLFHSLRTGMTFRRSEALIEATIALGGPWRAARLVRLVPRVIRDAFYTGVAASRHTVFGTYEACWLPAGWERSRFLD